MRRQSEPSWVHAFRIYGLPTCYVLYVITFWWFYKVNVLTSDLNRDFSKIQTIWLWAFRLSNWTMVPFASALFLTFLFYKTPPLFYPSVDEESIVKSRRKVPALILRIVTIGNYRRMVEESILYHASLINRYLHCDHFSVHLVTEKPLNLNRIFPGLVREIQVPPEYKSKSGSLGKARNLAYWLETDQLGADINNTPIDRTWIIDIDEDVTLSDSFMLSLSKSFLEDQSVAKIGFPQSVIKMNKNHGYVNQVMQQFRFSVDLAQHWPSMVLFKSTPAVCHGGCFVARADCSMDRNAECGPFCSISEDNAYMLAMIARKNVKFEFIDGWFFEDAPTSNMSSIAQRARWIRGHCYLAWYAPVSTTVKLGVAVCCFGSIVLLPITALLRVVFLYGALTGRASAFFPAGLQQHFICDQLTALILATSVFLLIYAAWFLFPWRQALVHSLFALTGIPLFILHVCDVVTAFLILRDIAKEAISGKTSFNMTVKKEGYS